MVKNLYKKLQEGIQNILHKFNEFSWTQMEKLDCFVWMWFCVRDLPLICIEHIL